MIDYFIMSKPLAAFIRFVGAIMDAPWGPHFGLTLTMYGKSTEILFRMVKPELPDNFLEVMKPKVKQKSLANTKRDVEKITRQKVREQEAAKEISEDAGRASKWCNSFLSTKFAQTSIDMADTAQKAIHDYSGAMGIPTMGRALSDNFGRWCRTFFWIRGSSLR